MSELGRYGWPATVLRNTGGRLLLQHLQENELGEPVDEVTTVADAQSLTINKLDEIIDENPKPLPLSIMDNQPLNKKTYSSENSEYSLSSNKIEIPCSTQKHEFNLKSHKFEEHNSFWVFCTDKRLRNIGWIQQNQETNYR